jgi:tetratricopeptide (TPR) repeat protein
MHQRFAPSKTHNKMKSIISLFIFLFFLTAVVYGQNAGKAAEAYNQGLRFQDRGDMQNALLAYDRAISLNPKMLDAYNNRATLKLASGDTAGALADLSKIIEISPKHALSFYNRGNILLERSEYDAAIADFTKAIDILNGLTNAYDKKAHAMSHNNRANALMAQGQFNTALADYARSLEILPNSYEALTGSGSAKQQLGDYAGAVADYSRALAIFPNHRVILLNRAGALEEIDKDAAFADYTKVIELDPKNAHAYAGRALILLSRGKKADAIADLRKAFELEPGLRAEYEAHWKEALK